MTSIRIRLNSATIKRLRNEYERTIISEHGLVPTDSQLVMVALLELESLKYNCEIDIKFKKNGTLQIKYK